MKTQFLIAAPTSGSGKTTIARGLMALYCQKGLQVQPFKCGPDYIDTKMHAAVCHRPSVNLDTFMATADHVSSLYARYSEGADVCIVEGMMGLFDGYDRDLGSSAEIARVLGLPVVLVVNARSAAYSLAPLLQGFATFRPGVATAGVIFNQVGSLRHAAMLRQVCADTGLRCYGCVPKRAELEQASRYLGLDFSQSPDVAPLTSLLEEHTDWQQLAVDMRRPLHSHDAEPPSPRLQHVSVAHDDEAFSFLYQEIIDRFDHPRFFNPRANEPLPADTELVYLPGGYPEKHLEELSRADRTRESLRSHASRGGRIVAECGGMMYLCRDILTDEGRFPLCDILPYTIGARRSDRRLSLGYRRFHLDGREYRGHEFHYTQYAGAVPPTVAQVYDARGEAVASPVVRQGGVLASYIHCNWFI